MMAFALWKLKGQRLPADLFKIPLLMLVLWLTIPRVPSHQVSLLEFDIDLEEGQIIVPTDKVVCLVASAIKSVVFLPGM